MFKARSLSFGQSHHIIMMTAVCGMFAGVAHAGPYDPPSSYYNGATSTNGSTLKTQLRSIISSASTRSYGHARDVLGYFDQDPSNASKCILFYNGASVQAAWSSGGTIWNREHTWPQSRGASSGPLNSDLHNLRPCNPSINSSRGNDNFGIGGSFWDPNNRGGTDRGETARIAFYCDTRYTHVSIGNGNPSGNVLGDKASMLAWHFDEPVDDIERRRNHLIHTDSSRGQGNRNPFVDHPEFVWAIYGTGSNNSTISVAAPEADGSSELVIDYGRFIGSVSDLGTETFTISKSGSHPTTFDVEVTGDVTSSLEGTGFAFPYNTSSKNVTVSLSPVGGFGHAVGSVLVTNTDLTSAGAGKGSADGQDEVVMMATVVDHFNASLDANVNTDTGSIDLGEIELGSGVVDLVIPVYALDTVPGFTAGFDVHSVVHTFGAQELVAAPNLITGVQPGEFASIIISVDTDSVTAGAYSAFFVVRCQDEDLPGASCSETLSFNANVTVVGGCAADWNQSGSLNDDDFFAFLGDFFGSGEADFNGSGTTNDDDFFAFLGAFFGGC